jgi:hypothetical protein
MRLAFIKLIKKEQVMKYTNMTDIIKKEDGKAGYLFAWLLGVPASVLFVIYLIFH